VTRKIVCFCEHAFEADIPESVDLGAEPSAEQEIIDGELMCVRCPECGKVLKPEFPVLVHDPQSARRIYMIPELDRSSFLRGALPYNVPQAERIVIGYDELAEKIRIRRAGFDDRVVELIKYYLLNKVLDGYEGERDIRILFSRSEGESLLFHAVGLKEDEVGVLKVPREMVDKVNARLEERLGQEPYATILKGPYVSVQNLYAEEGE
jgi:hypothetical protein